ncbi:MAG: lasso peptide biosynthesis B2 protein [Acidobacteriaceae bacterium]|nr:lasso peptide biosynthesis B2 protein [Acidobacteriaceae bacterium]
MLRLLIESWLQLAYIDFAMRFRSFGALDSLIRNQDLCAADPLTQKSAEELCHAIDLACVCYFKPVLCLQRSAATAVLLRRYGWSATMVIGAQIVPFKSHAWCELENRVINDKPYMREKYAVLEEY